MVATARPLHPPDHIKYQRGFNIRYLPEFREVTRYENETIFFNQIHNRPESSRGVEELEEELSFRDPNAVTQKVGSLTIKASLKVADKLVETTVAMSEVARAEIADDRERKLGRDNYLLSFQKLMHAFDTFVREYNATYLGKEMKTGWRAVYDEGNPVDLTLLMLWQYRNSCDHAGTLVDSDCQKRYESIFKGASEKGVRPVIRLPSTLRLGTQFVPKHTQFSKIKDCVFDYIGRRIPETEKQILLNRSYGADPSFEVSRMTFSYSDATGSYDVVLNYRDILAAGADVNWKVTPHAIDPFYVDHRTKRAFFYKNPVWMPVVIKPVNSKGEKNGFTVSIDPVVKKNGV